METENDNKPIKKNNLNTKSIPAIMMLSAGLISYIICFIMKYELQKMLIIIFVTMLVFAILGTVIKTVVDSFNMNIDYDDWFDDEGEIVEKSNSNEL